MRLWNTYGIKKLWKRLRYSWVPWINKLFEIRPKVHIIKTIYHIDHVVKFMFIFYYKEKKKLNICRNHTQIWYYVLFFFLDILNIGLNKYEDMDGYDCGHTYEVCIFIWICIPHRYVHNHIHPYPHICLNRYLRYLRKRKAHNIIFGCDFYKYSTFFFLYNKK